MFESLSDRLGKIFDGLTGRGALSDADVDAALREVRRALLEADVSLEVVKAFVEQVRERAVGAEVTRSVTPGQQVIKIVHDELVKVLGETAGAARFQRRLAGADPDGRPAGLGQDHHHRQDRQAPEGAAEQEGAAGLARHAPSGRHGAAARARRADRRRYAADRQPAKRRSRSPAAR